MRLLVSKTRRVSYLSKEGDWPLPHSVSIAYIGFNDLFKRLLDPLKWSKIYQTKCKKADNDI